MMALLLRPTRGGGGGGSSDPPAGSEGGVRWQLSGTGAGSGPQASVVRSRVLPLRRRNLRLSHLNSLANQALAQLRPAAACRPGCTNHGPPPHPAPPQHPARRHVAAASSAVAPQTQRRASDIALRRPACASPTLSLCALPARTPWARHLNAALRAGGRVAATAPAPSARGAQQQRHHRWLYVPRHTVSASQISINHSKRRLQPILGLDEPLGLTSVVHCSHVTQPHCAPCRRSVSRRQR